MFEGFVLTDINSPICILRTCP